MTTERFDQKTHTRQDALAPSVNRADFTRMSGLLAEKIPDPRLRNLAEGGSGDQTVDVIVELDVLLPKVVMKKDAYAGHHVVRPVAVEPESEEAQRELEGKVREARALFAEITGSTPRWLRPACAFVIQATGEQLRRVAASPLTRTIQPNRRLD